MKHKNDVWELLPDEKGYRRPTHIKKLRLLADENISQPFVEHLKEGDIIITSITDEGLNGYKDEAVRVWAKKRQKIIITTDKDFWDEKKHPIHECFGIICFESGPEDFEKLSQSFARFHYYFAAHFSLELWNQFKVFLKLKGFIIRQRTNEGIIVEEEYLFEKGDIWIRKLR